MTRQEKTAALLEQICGLIAPNADWKDTSIALLTYEWQGDTFIVNYPQALNVTLELECNGSFKVTATLNYTPADGSQDGDYGIQLSLGLFDTIRAWSMQSRQLIDLRRIANNSF